MQEHGGIGGRTQLDRYIVRAPSEMRLPNVSRIRIRSQLDPTQVRERGRMRRCGRVLLLMGAVADRSTR
jgi:hypothetical protein